VAVELNVVVETDTVAWEADGGVPQSTTANTATLKRCHFAILKKKKIQTQEKLLKTECHSSLGYRLNNYAKVEDISSTKLICFLRTLFPVFGKKLKYYLLSFDGDH
jgi:hypothetical protein